MPHTPAPKGRKLAPIRKIKVTPWDDEGNFILSVKVDKTPRLSLSRKCYLFSFEHGETDIEVLVDGIPRKVRLTFMLYAKIPSAERRRSLEQDALRAEQLGHPKLY